MLLRTEPFAPRTAAGPTADLDLDSGVECLRRWHSQLSADGAARALPGHVAVGTAIARTDRWLAAAAAPASNGREPTERLGLARAWMDATALLRSFDPAMAARCYDIALGLIVAKPPETVPRTGHAGC